MEFGLYERLARKGQMVIACDVRGIGETKPPHTPSGDWPGEFRAALRCGSGDHLYDLGY